MDYKKAGERRNTAKISSESSVILNGFTEKKEKFGIWYDENRITHEQSILFFSKVISSIELVESVKGRVKSKDECIRKFKRKYISTIESGDDSYAISSYISDLIGIRVVCFYAEDVDKIRTGLKTFFIETSSTDKTEILERTEDKFGYRSLHVQLKLRKNLKGFPEAKRFHSICFELQIRTVIQDAWSVLDHKIKYKKSIPLNLKRRINRLSALFEIAEDEFSQVKAEIEKEETKIIGRLKTGSKVDRNMPLDVFRFLFIALKYFPGYNFLEHKVDEFVQEILLYKKSFTEGEFDSVIKNYLARADSIEVHIGQKLNPYSKIRYCLYISDKKTFRTILSIYQKQNIERIFELAKTA